MKTYISFLLLELSTLLFVSCNNLDQDDMVGDWGLTYIAHDYIIDGVLINRTLSDLDPNSPSSELDRKLSFTLVGEGSYSVVTYSWNVASSSWVTDGSSEIWHFTTYDVFIGDDENSYRVVKLPYDNPTEMTMRRDVVKVKKINGWDAATEELEDYVYKKIKSKKK